MLQRYLLPWLILSSGVALLWPTLTSFLSPSPAAFDPFVATRKAGLLDPLIAVTMFCVGCLLPRDEAAQVAKRWPVVVGGTAIQYLSMPTLAYVLAHAAGLRSADLIGTIVVGCVPGAMASNVLTLAARGNVSYSVSLTTSATLLSPLVVPLALWLLLGVRDLPPDAAAAFDPRTVFVTLLLTVVGPVVVGHLASRRFDGFDRVMRRVGPIAANLTILWIIAVVVGLNRDRLWPIPTRLLTVLILLNVLGYAAGWLGAWPMRLPDSMRRALTLEIGMQNAGLGTVLVLKLFPDQPQAAIPTAAYTFGCMLSGTLLAQLWGRVPASDGVEATTE